jgi:TonB family protein
MLTTLLESSSHRTRNIHFAVGSATVHAVIVFLAAYATAMGAAAKDKPDNPVVIHWVPMPEPRPAVNTAIPVPAPRSWSVLPASRPLAVSIDVPRSLPSIDLELAPVTSDFARSATGNSDAANPSPADGAGGDSRRYYDVSEVETAVTVVGNTIPEYPPALRASGIEGAVAAEFVVTQSGRADVTSLRIISSTNDAFVESIRRALPRMRFHPARIGGRAVAQLVQQQFVFRLDR